MTDKNTEKKNLDTFYLKMDIISLPKTAQMELYDFYQFLKSKHNSPNKEKNLLNTFGTWVDNRSTEEIIAMLNMDRKSKGVPDKLL